MRRLEAAAAAVMAVVAVTACDAGRGPSRSSGSIAASQDSQYLYAADTDNGALIVLKESTLEKVAQVQVGTRPFRVAVGTDETIFVANRGSRSVTAVSHGDWSVLATIPTGVDPVGMQVSPDGKTLYVVSATATDSTDWGLMQAIDSKSFEEKWHLAVGSEPRGLAVVSDTQALVSLYKDGKVQNIDLVKQVVVNDNVDFYQDLNQSALTSASDDPTYLGAPSTYHARGMTDLAATPDGKRVFATTLLSREAKILTNPTPSTPYYEGQGPRLAGSVATPGLVTFDVANGAATPQVDDLAGTSYGYPAPQTSQANRPQTSFAVSGIDTTKPILQGTTVAVVDMTGDWLFMVNRDSSNVSVVTTSRYEAKPEDQPTSYSYYGFNELPSVHSTASIATGADGIVIVGDNKTAYVYSQFEHKVQRLQVGGNGITMVGQSGALVNDTLSPNEVEGRKLFHDSNNRAISAASASVACSSCHLEGRDDGHVWLFPDGPRQTPTLAGRGLTATAPYHWSGEFPDLTKFLDHTIISRMGGTGLVGNMETQLNAFVDGMPAPENPFKRDALTDAQTRGAAVFQRAQCGTCHTGQWLTNNLNEKVGSLVTTGRDPDNGPVESTGFNVPSLRGLARSAPYLHDGSALTLKERVTRDAQSNTHGQTSGLTEADVDDLVAYLQSL